MTSQETCSVAFANNGVTVAVESGTTLLAAAQKAKATSLVCCGLKPPCGRCRTEVHDGEEELLPAEKLEIATREDFA